MVRRKLKSPTVTEGARIKAPTGGGGSTQFERVRLAMEDFLNECILECKIDHIALWTDKLRRLTSCTWQQVNQAPRQGLGSEIIPRHQLADEVTRDLPPDTEFLAFRCSDAIRMIGFRRGAVLHVRFLAPDKKAY